jgi:hypothetical protein
MKWRLFIGLLVLAVLLLALAGLTVRLTRAAAGAVFLRKRTRSALSAKALIAPARWTGTSLRDRRRGGVVT